MKEKIYLRSFSKDKLGNIDIDILDDEDDNDDDKELDEMNKFFWEIYNK